MDCNFQKRVTSGRLCISPDLCIARFFEGLIWAAVYVTCYALLFFRPWEVFLSGSGKLKVRSDSIGL